MGDGRVKYLIYLGFVVALGAWAIWMLAQPVSAELSLNPNNHAPEAIWGIR